MFKLVSVFFLFATVRFAFGINTVATGYKVLTATTPRIDAGGKCHDVSNVSGKSVFVPTKTQNEWWSFLSFPPTNVTPTICPITPEYTTSAQQVLPSAALGVNMTENGTAWANSAWVQITASTANAIVITGVVVDLPSSTSTEFEIDVGKGAAASETVVATLSGVRRTGASGPWWLDFPIPIDNIAAGQRVAVRIRGNGTSTSAVYAKLTYYDKPVGGSVATTSVASTVIPTAANGVSVTPSGTAWANSAWVQVTAATASAIVLGGLSVNAGASEEFEIDVGTGGAGSETVVTTLRDNITNNNGGPYTITLKPALDNIASGLRLAVRMRKAGTSTAAWTIKLTYYSSPTGLTLPTKALKWAPSATDSTALTPSGTAWTSSAWSVLIPSAAAHLQIAGFEFDPGIATQFEFEFGVGPTGSEIVIGTYKGICSNTGLMRYFMPIRPLLDAVPQGAQLSTRLRTGSTDVTPWGIAVGYYEDSTSGNKASAYHRTLPSAANATTITPSGTGWANSSWVQISAAQANQIIITSISYDPGTAQQFEIDIGTGDPGSEVVKTTLAGNAGNTNGNQILFFASPLLIPASTRVAARLRKVGTSLTAWGIAMNYAEIQ